MSRNSRRAKQAPSPGGAPLPPQPQAQNNPFGLSFVVSTETVKLPSKGRFYPESSSLHGVAELQIKHLTAKEEDILANEDNLARGDVFDVLINSILIDKSIDSSELLEGDKMALLIAARITGYGSDYVIEGLCPACKKVNQFTFNLEECLEEQENTLPEGVTEEDGVFRFAGETENLEFGIRVLNSADKDYLSKQKDRRGELRINGSETIDFLNMVVVDVNRVTDTALLNKLFDVLSIADVRKIKSNYAKISPSVNIVQSVECSGCGHVSERQVPFSLGFFWPEL